MGFMVYVRIFGAGRVSIRSCEDLVVGVWRSFCESFKVPERRSYTRCRASGAVKRSVARIQGYAIRLEASGCLGSRRLSPRTFSPKS